MVRVELCQASESAIVARCWLWVLSVETQNQATGGKLTAFRLSTNRKNALLGSVPRSAAYLQAGHSTRGITGLLRGEIKATVFPKI